LDNQYRHRNNGVCADNEVFGWILPPEASFFFTWRLKDMTEKKTVSKPKEGAAKRKTAPKGLKAAPPRKRIPKAVNVVSESEIEHKAYALWESRGRPMGSPEEDWFNAKDHFGSGEAT